MNLSKKLLLALLFMAAADQSLAQDEGEKLINEAMCYACHQMESASLGPPWIAIAARHAARKDVMTDVLASKIVHGGGGNWGNVPMVPNQRVSEENAKIMAEWILALSQQQNQ